MLGAATRMVRRKQKQAAPLTEEEFENIQKAAASPGWRYPNHGVMVLDGEVSAVTRTEVLGAIRNRYPEASKRNRSRMLDELVVTGHATSKSRRPQTGPG